MANGKDRDRRVEARGRRMVRGQQQCGLTIRAFCCKSKVQESAFYFWRKELERRDTQRHQAQQEESKRRARASKAAFVPVRVAASAVDPVLADVSSEASGRIPSGQ